MKISDLNDGQYGLLFDVRRSMRYHDRRRAFFERLHQITSVLTILLAGSVLFDLARPGDTPAWMLFIATVAALLSVLDMVVGYSSKACAHLELKKRFANLEMQILSGDLSENIWNDHQLERLRIEQDEMPIYRALDTMCYNEIIRAEGYPIAHAKKVSMFQRTTRHFLQWSNINA